MAIKYNNEYETERRESTQKTVDNLYSTMYNESNNTAKYDVSNYVKKQNTEPDTTKRFGFASEINGWAKKNSDAIKYAGDCAINSIKRATKDYLNKYLKDAPEETDKDELFDSITNLYEYLDIKNYNWLKEGNIDKDNLICGQMNQSMLMDLWNNSVARTLGNDKSYREKNVDELFEIAMNQNLIIDDVNKVYDFLGIKHCADQYTYTVNVMWDIATGNITVYDVNGNEFMTLKMGV